MTADRDLPTGHDTGPRKLVVLGHQHCHNGKLAVYHWERVAPWPDGWRQFCDCLDCGNELEES